MLRVMMIEMTMIGGLENGMKGVESESVSVRERMQILGMRA